MVRIGVDIGGTFTDIVLWSDDTGEPTVHKLPSTPGDPSEAALLGIREVLSLADAEASDVGHIFHGTTTATNVVVQHSGAKVGFITSAGYRDILHAARHKKPYSFSLFQDLPWQKDPLVRRRHRLAVPERMTADGETLTELDEAAVAEAATELRDEGVDAIAIGFLFSFSSPEHEQRAKEICAEIAPDTFVCTSSEVVPEFREYERFSTTALNAYVAPSVRAYVRRMADSLREEGIEKDLHLMNSAGGVTSSEGAIERPATLLMSGPVAGVLGGIWAGGLSDHQSVITLDVGGTSADIGVAPDGALRMKHILDSTIAGFHTMLPMAECESIGAGGGSIAFVDEGGVLRVGPKSAGADPGPAAYGRGGTEPTVTDAQVALGRLLPDGLLSGGLPLDRELAVNAVSEHVADPLGMSVEEAALGVVEIATENMVRAIEMHSVRKGFDPRDFSLVAIGGAGPFFGADIASRMNIPRVIVPPHPGLTSAMGLLTSDTVSEYSRSVIRMDAAPELSDLAKAFADLEREAVERFERDGVSEEDRALTRHVDCRYEGQGYELRVDCPEGEITDSWWEGVEARFHEAHQREYFRSNEDQPVIPITVRLRAEGRVSGIDWPSIQSGSNGGSRESHDVWFRLDGKPQQLKTPFYERSSLHADQRIEGPAVIQQFESTTVLPPNHTITVAAAGNLISEANQQGQESS